MFILHAVSSWLHMMLTAHTISSHIKNRSSKTMPVFAGSMTIGVNVCRCSLKDVHALMRRNRQHSLAGTPGCGSSRSAAPAKLGLEPDAVMHQLICVDEVQLLARDACRHGHGHRHGHATHECQQTLHTWLRGESLAIHSDAASLPGHDLMKLHAAADLKCSIVFSASCGDNKSSQASKQCLGQAGQAASQQQAYAMYG